MGLWPFTRKGLNAQDAAAQVLRPHAEDEALAHRLYDLVLTAEDYCPDKGQGEAKAAAVCQFMLATHPHAGLDYDLLREALNAMVQVLNEDGWPRT